MSKKLATIFALVLVAALALPGAMVAASEPAEVYVAHGIPGQDVDPGLDPALPVDVSVDGACVLQGFVFGEIVGPLSLPAGSYDIAISLADPDNPCGNDPVIGPVSVPFAEGENATVIAHLTADGAITASKFENDFSPMGRGQARLIAHHTAYAPAVNVDVRRDGAMDGLVIPGFANGDQAVADVRPGKWLVSLFPALTAELNTPVFGPVPVGLRPFTIYLVYAVGSVDSGSFTLLVKDINVGPQILPIEFPAPDRQLPPSIGETR
jgi:hypothetical protein